MIRIAMPTLLGLLTCFTTHAQSGSIQISFTPTSGAGKSVTIQVAVAPLKYNNPHGYWFLNPHNGDRHLQYAPEMYWADRVSTAVYLTFNERKDDFDVYDGTGRDTNAVSVQNKEYVISAPEYQPREGDKNKPLHVHITSFSASECSFTISGQGKLESIKGSNIVAGAVQGSGHLYREPIYDKSDLLPGCDCDPTIYAAVYDEENNVRTTSACENALKNKVFDAVQKSLMPLYKNINYKGAGSMDAGNISINPLAGHVDINVPVKDRPWCSSDYRSNWLTTLAAQKTFYSNEDGYGLRFIKMPTAAVLGGGSADPEFQKRHLAFMESAMKEVMAGKMTSAQYEKADKDFILRETGGEPVDFKQQEMQLNLYLSVIINPFDRETMLLKLGDKRNTAVQHHVKGAAFEVFSGQAKDSDGSWTPNRVFVYIGKFDNPVAGKSAGGYDAYITKAAYPPNGNKLSIYNIIIKLEGGKDLIDKALANIDFESLEKLITR